MANELGISKCKFVPTIGYVYLFRFCYSDAEAEKNDTNPCKLGSTQQSVEHRIKSKKAEWKDDREHETLLILCVPIDKCEAWEKLIHGILVLRNKWIDTDEAKQKGLKGKEWFYTSSDEVRAIYKGLQKLGTIVKINTGT